MIINKKSKHIEFRIKVSITCLHALMETKSSNLLKALGEFQITTNKMQRFLIYIFLQTLYMFQAVPPPIIRST